MIIVLIDHRRARFFEPASEGRFTETGHLEPLDPRGFERHLEHRKEADYRGQRVPEADEFYERIAQRLRNGPSILLLGDATGKSSAMSYLLAYLKQRHKEISDRVVAAQDADVSSISLGRIEQIARDYSH